MSKQEYVEWAMEDIVVSLDENTDIIVSWFVGSKDCRCPITSQINDAVLKLIERYDIVIFDCEFDLKYLNQLVDTDIDTTLIVNKADGSDLNALYEFLKRYDLDVLGVIPIDEDLKTHSMDRESTIVQDAIKQFYFRLNLPQVRE